MTRDQEKVHALLGKLARRQNAIEKIFKEWKQACEDVPRSITEEIDSIPGRRIFYNLSDRQNFTIDQNAQRGQPLSFEISQDGAFVMTHYPLVAWKPNSPATATNFGRWSPVASWPLPTQQAADQDRIDLSYEIEDGGSQRNFQNEAAAPVFSRPDNIAPLPVPTLWAPNSVIRFFPTFEDIFFDPDPATPTDGGELVVTIMGYRIVNL